jgi:hypothetical protein
MKSIDLHGVKHNDAQKVLDSFFWEMITKNVGHFQVITGNSDKMKQIVYELCEEYGFEIDEELNNSGSLIIFC